MYQYLTGKLIEKTPTSAVVEVGGVGYLLQVPVSTYSALPESGERVKIWTHLAVREDAHILFGFATEDEREMFRLLISVSGIGPKTAVGILSGAAMTEFKRAIIEGSLAFLTGIPGIGRKTAERLVIELREKLVVDKRAAASLTALKGADSEVVEDSLRALIELGYRRQNAREAIEKVLQGAAKNELSVPELVRASLKHI